MTTSAIQRSTSGAAFEVSTGTHLTVRGLSFNRGIECTATTLDVQNLLFDASTETRSWLVLSSCTTSVVDSELLNSSSLGIDAKNSGKLEVIGSSIKRSADDGIRAASTQLSVVRASVELNSRMGIRATSGQATIRRSWVHRNTLGGVSVLGTFDVTNNFVIRNGNDGQPPSDFGGLRLESQVAGNRVDHNTVIQNTTIPQSTLAGGLYCKGSTAMNNIIADNVAGNEQAPNAQIAGTCTVTGSLIREEVTAFNFVRPYNDPVDYHLADAQSIAVDTSTVSLQPVDDDYDGDPRSDGKPDVGADELEP